MRDSVTERDIVTVVTLLVTVTESVTVTKALLGLVMSRMSRGVLNPCPMLHGAVDCRPREPQRLG